MTELEELTLSGVSFIDDANFSSLKSLKNLISLSIICSTERPIKSISSNLFYLNKLKNFNLKDCPGATISPSLDNSLNWSNLKNLEILNLINDRPTPIDIKYLDDLPNLKELILNFNEYTTIPKNIGNLKSLEEFRILRNSLNSLPKFIGDLENLKILDMSYNKLTSIPDEIGNLKNLEWLLLYNNEITNIPSTLGNLENLVKLELSHN